MNQSAFLAAAFALAACLPVLAHEAESLAGTYALPDGRRKVGSVLVATPGRDGARVSPDLALHVLSPKVGPYLLWVQFVAGAKVRTTPFVVAAS